MSVAGDRKYNRKGRTRKVSVMSWDMCPSDLLKQLIAFLTGEGYAVLFGVSGNGGTLTVYVYADGDKEVYYIRPKDSFYEVFGDILADMVSEAIADALNPPEAPAKNSKGKDTRSDP